MANIVYYEDIQLVDGVKGFFGTGSDMEIFHNGSQAYIENYTGEMNFTQHVNDGDMQFKCDDGSGSTEIYFYLDGSLADGTYNYTRWNDGGVITFGGDQDLRIWHDPSNSSSYIRNYTNDLFIENTANDSDIIFKTDDGSGGTTEYFSVQGANEVVYFSKDFKLADNVKGNFGNAGDLKIYHDGSNSYIDETGTGSLYIKSAGAIRLQSDTGENMIYAVNDGAVNLYHNNSKKFETTSAGIDVTGTTVTDGLTSSDSLVVDGGGSNSILLKTKGSARIALENASATDSFYISNTGGSGSSTLDLGGALTLVEGGLATFTADINMTDGEMLMWGGNSILTHSGSATTIGDNSSGSVISIASGNSTFAGNIYMTGTGHIGAADNFYVGGATAGTDHTYIGDSGRNVTIYNGATFTVASGNTTLGGNLEVQGADVTITSNVIHSGDSNTYFGFHGNDLWRVVTGGSERLEVSNSGLKLGNTGATVTQILDEDNMASNSATSLATQQSIKAYVDSSTTGVLTYQGIWNADTNSPTLSSGSGTPGYYYIVSVAGSTNLDGITDWAVGDWAVFSDQATDAWQKIDNTAVGNVSGAGGANYVTKWTGSGTIANSSIIDQSGTVTFSGDVTVGDELTITTVSNATGDPDKFLCISGGNTVGYRTGAQVLSDIGAASSGSLASYLPLAGGTMTGDVIYNDSVRIKLGTGGGNSDIYHNGTDMYMRNLTTAGDMSFSADSTGSGGAATAYFWLDGGIVKTRFAKEATFADNVKLTFGNVTSPDLEIFHDGSHSRIKDVGTGHLVINATDFVVNNSADSKNMIIASDGGSVNLYYNGTQHFRTVSTGVEVTGSIKVTGDGSNAATLTETGAGLLTIATVDDLILDSGSDITLDAGGNDIRLFNGGVEYGKFKNDSSDLSLYSSIQDKDIIFKGNDGGSTIDALTLDMSAGGAAIFNDLIYVPSYMVHTGDSDTKIGFNTADNVEIRVGGNLQISASSSRAYLRYQGSNKIQTDSAGVDITGGLTTTASSSIAGAQFTSNTSRNDNLKSIYGTDGDIEIYSDNTTAFMEITNVTNFIIGDSTQFNTANIAIARVGTQTGFKSIEEDWFGVYSDANTGKTHLTISGTEKLRTDNSGVVVSGNVVLNGDSNIVLDTSVSSTQSSGTIIKMGSHMSALVAGNIYYAGNSMGNLYWYGADADSSSTENMLALSVGTDADVDGMLLNGIYHKASHGLTVGEPIYLSTTSMAMTNTAPSGANDYVRVLGYALDSNHIYFCPDNTWVKISS